MTKLWGFIFCLVIVTSLLAVSTLITQETGLDSLGTIPQQDLTELTDFPDPESTGIDTLQTEIVSVANTAVSNFASVIEPEQPFLNDPYINRQWALNQIEIPRLWQITTGAPETIVAILDTGIDKNHEELDGKIVAEVNFSDSPSPHDVNGHGTHVAGIIVASSNNNMGVAGIAPESRVMNVKVADDAGRCQATQLAKGIVWAVDNGASVINISLVLKNPSPEVEDAVNYAWGHGALVIAAAGNDGSASSNYPAYYENSIAVAATRQDDTLAPLSNYGNWVDVAAPGLNIYSTLQDDGYGYKSGTSFATAYVSGLATLLFAIATDTNGNGILSDEVRAAMEAGAQKTGNYITGNGRIDAAGALTRIDSSTPGIYQASHS